MNASDPEGRRKLAGGVSHRLTRKGNQPRQGRHSTLLLRAYSLPIPMKIEKALALIDERRPCRDE